MSRSIRSAFLALSTLCAVACGGPRELSHGIAPDRPLDSLSAAERQLLCADSVAALGGEGRRIECADGGRIEVQRVSDCEAEMAAAAAAPSCRLTVGDLDACTRDHARDFCVDTAACDAVARKAADCQP